MNDGWWRRKFLKRIYREQLKCYSTKNLRISCILAETWTKHLPNASLEYYDYANYLVPYTVNL
jgi:hypothetical protein